MAALERAAAKDGAAASARAAAKDGVAASARVAANGGVAAAPVAGLPGQSEPYEQDENEESDSEAETADQRPVDAAANCKTAALTTAEGKSSDGGGGKEPAESYVTKIKIYPVTSAFRPPTRLRSDSRTVSVISITSGGGRGGFRRRPSRTSNRERPSIRPSRRRYVELTIHKLNCNTFAASLRYFFRCFLTKK